MSQNKNPIIELKRQLIVLKRRLPDAVGLIAKKHFENNFRNQGFDGQKWDEVERRKPGTKAYEYATKAQRTVGILSGKTKLLAKSIYVKSASWDKIVVASSSKYGAYHNDGTPKMKRRRFMGYSIKLNKKILSFVKSQADKIFKQ